MTNHNPKQTQTKKSSTQAAASMGHPWALIPLCSLGRQPQPQPPVSRCLIHPTGRNKEGMTISLVVFVISFRETWGSGTSPPTSYARSNAAAEDSVSATSPVSCRLQMLWSAHRNEVELMKLLPGFFAGKCILFKSQSPPAPAR